MKYPLTDIDEVQSTKERILLVAARMFAEQGYAAVSLRDIAERVNIKASSIYNHFESKEALFSAIVDTIEQVYMDFYSRMDDRLAVAESFEQVLDSLFEELIQVYHMFIQYGVSLIATEQLHNQKANHAFNDVYMRVGIEYAAKAFEASIQRGWVAPFDTLALATFFMNSVFVGTLMRTREDLGYAAVFDPTQMFLSLKSYMLGSVELLS